MHCSITCSKYKTDVVVSGASFPKKEHIVSTRLIETLFGSGSMSAVAYPLRAVYQKIPRCQIGVPVQILISVPKKRLKHAVDRNRVKRQIREAYRLNKQPLCDAVPADQSLLVAFVWIADELVSSAKVGNRIERLVKRMAESICGN